MNQIQPSSKALELACQVLRIEGDAVLALIGRIDGDFLQALSLILNCHGRVIVSGIGKSGHIGCKIASTLASTGTPAFFVHPAEASHGDLGMITADDVMIVISNSGESAELLNILPSIKRQGAKLIAMTGNPNSSLARDSDAHLDAGVAQEACPLNLAPTASTTAALALGDALAVALLDARGFGAEDFARSHPGGSLGRQLLTRIRDVMRIGMAIPSVLPTASVADATREISRGGIGMTVVVTPEKAVLGIFTDGDLRRAIVGNLNLQSLTVADIMSGKPRLIGPDKLTAEAVEMMEKYKINQIPVVDENQRLIGALNMHDLFQAKAL
ncbi:KpsF/GutQ family sugar-phosphate isomerase [Propionivibrio sp.]|uniref:KpsF/GutQ family sugar-phosphate isomerase n=2 Tax=Propionivibrio sp. TaxID=2212460 RepID=UPI0025D3DCEC|nr:KpsF/GutQ family sugar-phosphate isomerase [Propionivibrio sp.]MBK7357429.1 KpsF/GutQ family sugar-phosphate isomerase [Propionivibrio sp.]MBK8399835.1 KpsF/GutQ family sugar-phosphate isomerase [Propionivibrio sp.]MBK8743275.1 KpsF/GutQ family sugar-phosphate isomerase [Propionivibrio sp.]MBK8894710.1 KpsF/GutQ family sugar-phosphate isomerase [Propionivibrio sp.]MBL0207194.1 KpsF/GutQ family sugar-phosphate isomerase [Propionivibrio sp.]